MDSDDYEQNVCPKDQVSHYYMKFGRERNLEKFLRLKQVESPCSFGTFENQEPHCSTALPVQEEIVQSDKNSNEFHSLVSPTKTTQTEADDKCPKAEEPKTATSSSSSSEPFIRIREERITTEISSKGKKFKDRASSSKPSEKEKQEEKAETDEDFRTPNKTRTPESATKSHKRLEWDSWADVGYRRCKSSGNISALERLVLDQLLQDCGINEASAKGHKVLTRILKTNEGQMQRAKSLDSPPLACSTHLTTPSVHGEEQVRAEQKEKSVQTSYKRSRGVQVDLLSAESSEDKPDGGDREILQLTSESKESSLEKHLREPSVLSKISTNSDSISRGNNFGGEHLKSAMTTSESNESSLEPPKTKSRDYNLVTVESLLETMSSNSFQMMNIKSKEPSKELSEKLTTLASSKLLNEEEGTSNEYGLQKSNSCEEFNCPLVDKTTSSKVREKKSALKEFQDSVASRASPSRQSAQLDLGIQLLCELIDARSLSKSQKEKLLNDVVRRICSITGTDSQQELLSMHKEMSRGSTTRSEYKNIPTKQHNEEKAHISPPTTSAAAAAKETRTKMLKNHGKDKNSQPIAKTNTKNVNEHYEGETISSTNTKSAPLKSLSSTDDSSKMASKHKDSSGEARSIPAWCQPMTHSEFEYEERRRIFEINASTRHGVASIPVSELSVAKHDVLINWLDMEISRLDRLRQVMVHAAGVPSKSSSSGASLSREEVLRTVSYSYSSEASKKMAAKVKEPPKALYDEVASVNTTTRTLDEGVQKSQEQSSNIIELSIEESKENMRVDKRKPRDNIKYTQPALKLEALRERNIQNNENSNVYGKTLKVVASNSHSTTSSKASSSEIAAVVQPRSKMATPPSSSSASYSRSSFEETQKQLKSMAVQTNLPIEQSTQTMLRPPCQCVHKQMSHNNYHYPYNVCVHPHSMQPNAVPWNCCSNYMCQHAGMASYYTTPLTPAHYATQSKTTIKQAANETPRKSTATEMPATTAARVQSSSQSSHVSLHDSNTYTKVGPKRQEKSATSSSVLSSSEVSIPMGSAGQQTRSTTTTHQYDDLDSFERHASQHSIAVQTSTTLLYRQIPEEVSPGVQTAPLCYKPRSIAYVLEFKTRHETQTTWKYTRTETDEPKKQEEPTAKSENVAGEDGSRMTLQAHLEQARPSFVANTKQRKAILNQLHVLRQEREKEMREIIENTSINSIERKLDNIAPPAINQVRVFSTTQMKALTRKRARKLPERLEREHREQEERRRRGYRLLRDVFNRRLQKLVRVGQISLNHSRTMI